MPRPATVITESEVPFTIANRTPVTTTCPQTGKTNEVRGLTWEELNESGLLAEQVDTENPPTINVFARDVRYRYTHPTKPLSDEQKARNKVVAAQRRERQKAAMALYNEAVARGDISDVATDEEDADAA